MSAADLAEWRLILRQEFVFFSYYFSADMVRIYDHIEFHLKLLAYVVLNNFILGAQCCWEIGRFSLPFTMS